MVQEQLSAAHGRQEPDRSPREPGTDQTATGTLQPLTRLFLTALERRLNGPQITHIEYTLLVGLALQLRLVTRVLVLGFRVFIRFRFGPFGLRHVYGPPAEARGISRHRVHVVIGVNAIGLCWTPGL